MPFVIFIIVSALVFLIVGVLLVVSPKYTKNIEDILDSKILDIEKKVKISNKAVGALFIAVGILLLYIIKSKL